VEHETKLDQVWGLFFSEVLGGFAPKITQWVLGCLNRGSGTRHKRAREIKELRRGILPTFSYLCKLFAMVTYSVQQKSFLVRQQWLPKGQQISQQRL